MKTANSENPPRRPAHIEHCFSKCCHHPGSGERFPFHLPCPWEQTSPLSWWLPSPAWPEASLPREWVTWRQREGIRAVGARSAALCCPGWHKLGPWLSPFLLTRRPALLSPLPPWPAPSGHYPSLLVSSCWKSPSYFYLDYFIWSTLVVSHPKGSRVKHLTRALGSATESPRVAYF